MASSPLDKVLSKVDLNCAKFADQAKIEKCNELNKLVKQYKTDMSSLVNNNESNIFTDVMKLHQYRDNNWQHNYNTTTKKGEINKITKNLNKIVHNMTNDYNDRILISNMRTNTIKGYEDIARYQEDDLVRLERRADAAQDRLTLRNRLVTINNVSASQKSQIIYLLKVFFVMMLVLIPAFVAYLMGSLSVQGFFGVFLLMVIVYIIFVIIEMYYTGDSSLQHMLQKDVRKFNKRFYHLGQGMDKAFDNYVQTKCSQSIPNNDPGYVPVM